MKITIKRVILLVQLFLIVAVSTAAEQPVYPIRVSENRRYFIDQNDNHVFWLGTTQW